MKSPIVLNCMLLVGLVVSGAGISLAAHAAEPLVLARVEMSEAMTRALPVYAQLQDAAGKEYAVVLAPRAQVEASGAPYRGFETAVRASDYVIARERRHGARANAARYAPVVYDDGRQIIVRATLDQAQGLAELGFDLRRLPDAPLVRREPPALSVSRVITPDPVVATMMAQVQAAEVYTHVGDLSGEWPVTVGGEAYTIDTRNTLSGTPIEKATQYVYERMQASGLTVSYQQWSKSAVANRNVIGEIRGTTRPDEIVLVTAHVDDMPSSGRAPGADDNASGSVGVLTAADILGGYRFERTVRFVLFTGEEQGLLGSDQYAAAAAARGDNIVADYNMDMIGWDAVDGPTLRLHTRALSNPGYSGDVAIANLFVDVVSAYGLSGSLTPIITADGIPASDHASFWHQGYAAILAIEDDDDDFNVNYHTSSDRLAALNLDYFTNFVKASVGTAAHLAYPVSVVPTPTTTPAGTLPATSTPTLTPTPTVTRTLTPTATPTLGSVCPQVDLGSTLPTSYSGTTVGAQNLVGGASCGAGGNNAPDASFRFTAPASGTYRIDTAGSAFDTVLYVRNGTCGGAQLACNDDANGTVQSLVSVSLSAGQSVVIVVDGYSTRSGAFTLTIRSVTGPTPTPAATSAATGTATGTPAPSVTQSATPPPTSPPTVTPTATQSPVSTPSVIQTAAPTLTGKPTASSTLTPTATPTEGSTCPQVDLGSTLPTSYSGSTVGAQNLVGGASCGAGGNNAPDASFRFTAPASGTYRIDTAGSAFDTVLYVRNGTCGGAQLACNDDANGTVQSLVSVSLSAGQSVVIVVDGYSTRSGAFTLTIRSVTGPTPTPAATSAATGTATGTPAPSVTQTAAPTLTGTPTASSTLTPTATPTEGSACPQVDLGSTLPTSYSGSTVGAQNLVGGASCGAGGNNAPDASFRFTAPASGTYRIDTAGSAFDTVLYVRNGTCGGAQLACNDDANGTVQSLVSVSVSAGQAVVIVVDGYGTRSGTFTLSVTGPTAAPLISAPWSR